MEKKKLTKYLWNGKDLDLQGNPVIPAPAPDGRPLDGLNEGELYLHNYGSPTLWTVNNEGKVVKVVGGGGTGDGTYLRKDQADATPFSLGVGALVLKSKDINNLIRYYDEEKPEVVTDVDIYSALMTDEKIKEQLKDLDDRYLRKDKEDTAHKHITFEEGITVYQLAKMMKLEVSELATIARAIVDILGSSKFVDGFFGEGYQIWKAIATGDWCMTIDRLTVRKVMSVYELIIQKIRSVGGMIAVSAGNGKVKEVEQVGLEYKFTFEDENNFQVNDLMRCQVWTGSGVKYYWVEVVRVDGQSVYTRVADYYGVTPSVGDEVVLMGNTKNKLRQGLVLISAAEDGQPRVDCLDGIHTKNFDGCLKARLGSLDGISDDRFPADMQPKGYGLYGNNCYLTGVFVLSNGKDVQTQFAILEGMIHAELSSIRQEVNEEDNYLSNASFVSNLDLWEYSNDVRIFNTSGGLLHFNGDFYSNKLQFAGITANQGKNVLRLKSSYILQKNEDFRIKPEFKLVEQFTTDSEGNEVSTGIKLYRPRMFYASFKYMVAKRGTLEIYFKNEENLGTFEEYVPLSYKKVLEESSEFVTIEIAGKWNGTGDFYLAFDGDIYLYNLALSDNKLADMEEIWNMQLEITEKKIQANAEHIIQQGEDLEEYRSDFLLTAEQLRSEFNTLVQNTEKDITEAYTGLVSQTSQELKSDYNAKFGDYYGTITEEYNSKITQTAKDITAELTAKIDNTNKDLADTEAALIKDYEAKISASAQSLTSDYNAKITDLRTGDIATMKSSITQNANQIATKVSQTDFDSKTGEINTSISNLSIRVDGISSSVTSIQGDVETAQKVASAAEALAKTAQMTGVYGSEEYNQTSNPWQGWTSGTEYKHVGAIWYNPNTGKTKRYIGTDNKDTWEDVSDSEYASATFVFQNKDKWSAIATKFDSNGNPLSTSGFVTTSNYAAMFSEQWNDNDSVRAEIGTFVTKNTDGTLESGVKITADNVDINNGVVQIDSNSATIGGFEVSDNALTNLTAGTSSGASIYISNSSQTRFARLNGGEGTITAAEFRNDDGTAVYIQAYGGSSNYGLKILGNQDSKALHVTGSSYFIARRAGMEFTYVSGLKVCTRQGSSFTASADSSDPYFPSGTQVDFLVVTSAVTLPDASTCRGKVYFIKRRGIGSVTAVNVYSANGDYSASKTWSNDYSRIFISDGIYWNEFVCGF